MRRINFSDTIGISNDYIGVYFLWYFNNNHFASSDCPKIIMEYCDFEGRFPKNPFSRLSTISFGISL
jgi:hypothetical protein